MIEKRDISLSMESFDDKSFANSLLDGVENTNSKYELFQQEKPVLQTKNAEFDASLRATFYKTIGERQKLVDHITKLKEKERKYINGD